MMIPRIQQNEHWQDPLVPEFIWFFNLQQQDQGVYIHWCEINGDPDQHPAVQGDILPYIPDQVIQDVKQDKARLVFSTWEESVNPTDDYPIEHCIDFDLTLEKFCTENNIPHRNVFWISGDLRVKQRQKSKLIRAAGFTCYGHDIYRQLKHNIDPQDWTLKPITEREFEKHFVCLQRYMKPGRIYWTWLMYQNSLIWQGNVSVADRIHGWSFLDRARTFYWLAYDNRHLLSKTDIADSDLSKIWHDLAELGLSVPLTLDVPDHDKNWCAGYDTTVSSLPYYNNSFASVITETDIQSSGLFISEATFRAFVYQQPTIWVGQSGLVAQLQEWGFKTWDWLFSEEYDQEPFMFDRLQKCMNSLEQITQIQKTPELLEKIHQQNLYNWNHLTTDFLDQQRDRFAKLLAEIVE